MKPSWKGEFELLVQQIELHAEVNPETGKELKVNIAEAAKERGRGFFRRLGKQVEKITKDVIRLKTGIRL